MPPRKSSIGPRPVEAIIHADKRTNLPTADAQEFVGPEIESPQTLLYQRKPELDPQLVWRGKDEQDRKNLEIDAPPIYIQEKIDPRVLIANLRRAGRDGSPETELSLFESFDGLDAMELVEFYQHSANWSNRMILGDSLNVMASLAEREGLRGQVQTIYIDPPYGIKFNSNWQASIRDRNVKDGSLEDAAREVEQIKAFRDTWELGIHSYLAYLRDRLFVARDLLNETGSAFVQIGDENVHLVRSLMDEVFGSENFRSLVSFRTSVGLGAEGLDNVTNYVVWYSKSQSVKFRQLFQPTKPGEPGASRFTNVVLADGQTRRAFAAELEDPTTLPSGAHLFRDQGLTSRSGSATTVFPFEYRGRSYRPPSGGWRTSLDGMHRLAAAYRLLQTGNTLSYLKYWDDFSALSLTNFWDDVSGGITSRSDPKIYVVQTATKIVERCILMTSDPGDLVLDPTCGSGTSALVAEHWGRRWITVDTSRVALALARQRLMGAAYPYFLLSDSDAGRRTEQELSGQPVSGPPAQNDVRQGFVYQRLPHVTLKSIASNPSIQPNMSRQAIESVVHRNAEYELLYDRPIEDERRVRVSGPFSIESLSPHRSLAFAPSTEPMSVREAAIASSSVSFEGTILANLAKAGIQNGHRNERLEFESVEAYGGRYIQAIGLQRSDDGGTASRVAISVGPQYGTVGPPFIKGAAREAIRDDKVDLLCVLGFAFDPTALGTADEYHATTDGFASVAAERSLGRVPVLLVRMNVDLVMGEDLKKTGAGNLFTVFGEPEIAISSSAEGLTVEIKGVDVYDPTTGEVRSSDPDRIALWMIDSSYNGESFFVRHCYFTGGVDPYRRLKAALKAEIDQEAWASLYRTLSRPFPRPETGKIAVKVINDYGDEVLKVFDV